jgi:hypothetical protein
MLETDIKSEIINGDKEFWLLFFEEKIDRFIKGYEMKKVFTDDKKSCEEDGYNAFSNKTFGSRLGSVVNKMSTTKNRNHYKYLLIKDNDKKKCQKNENEVDLDDISC